MMRRPGHHAEALVYIVNVNARGLVRQGDLEVEEAVDVLAILSDLPGMMLFY
jgi:hypothetical protein